MEHNEDFDWHEVAELIAKLRATLTDIPLEIIDENEIEECEDENAGNA